MPLPGSPLTIFIVAVLTCLPPFLALRLVVRSYRRAVRHGVPSGRFLAAIGLTLVIFLFNLGVLVGTSIAMSHGVGRIGPVQMAAAGLAWITFWVWLFLAFALGRDLGRRSGLR